jgi:ketosteroid isomerase-like protein
MNNKIKGLLIGFAALPLAVGCGSDGDSTDSAVEQTQQVQEELIAAFEAGDAEAMNALYADDAVFVNATMRDEVDNRPGMLRLQQWVTEVTDRDQSEIVDEFVSADGTQGVIVYHWVGNRSDNGEAFDLDMTHVLEYEDGKVTHVTVSYANPDAYDQLAG